MRNAADIFLLSSHKEVAGFALMEAMACGASPVVSDIPAFRAQTGNGAIGALATAGDAASFAEAILRVAARPREEARATVLAHFARHLSFDAVGARMAAAYRAILDAAP